MKTQNGVTGYVSPNDAGLNSELRAVGRRIAKMLDALADNCNTWLVSGPIWKECYDFRIALIHKLEDDGWEVALNSKDNYTVKPTKAYWDSLKPSVEAK